MVVITMVGCCVYSLRIPNRYVAHLDPPAIYQPEERRGRSISS